MVDTVAVGVLTDEASDAKIAIVPKRDASSFKPAESFGTWLKYLRQLTGLNQEEAAKQANVSFDAVKRMERGRLVGSAHLLAWLAWLDTEAAHKNDDELNEEIEEEFKKWPDKALNLGLRIREAGLAMQPPKGRSQQDTESTVRTKALSTAVRKGGSGRR